jgi:hypothetical protein
MFWSKCHSAKGNFIVAICDEKLLGKTIGKEFEVKVEERFYKGELIDYSKAEDLMKKADICNLLGKEIVEFAIKKKFIIRENVILIDGIPHAQFIK